MTMRKDSFKVGGWYHCFNRSIEGRVAFADSQDYFRFLELLYVANDESPLRHNDLGVHTFEEALALPRGKGLVAISAFCLMPGSYSLVIREIAEGGITAFMRKLGTAYTLYFNARHTRAGNLFLKPFRSHHASSDRSVQNLINYVHATPAVLYEPEWKLHHVVDPQFLEEHLRAYPYSSLAVYADARSPNAPILDAQTRAEARIIPLQKMLQEARHYSIESGIP